MINASSERTFTPSELALFCQSPLAAWWSELDRRKIFKGQKLKQDPLNEILKKDGIRHEEKLIKELENQNFKVKRFKGKQEKSNYEECIKAMIHGYDFIYQQVFIMGRLEEQLIYLKE